MKKSSFSIIMDQETKRQKDEHMVCCSSTANINLYLPYREKKD
jgi:hypothetical protein